MSKETLEKIDETIILICNRIQEDIKDSERTKKDNNHSIAEITTSLAELVSARNK